MPESQIDQARFLQIRAEFQALRDNRLEMLKTAEKVQNLMLRRDRHSRGLADLPLVDRHYSQIRTWLVTTEHIPDLDGDEYLETVRAAVARDPNDDPSWPDGNLVQAEIHAWFVAHPPPAWYSWKRLVDILMRGIARNR